MEDPALGKGLLRVGVFALVPVLKEWMGRSSQWNVGKNRDWENEQGVRESVGGTGDVETGKLCLEGRKEEPGGGRRLEGQDEPGDEGVGSRGEEPSECGESTRGAPRDGAVWNQRVFVELCGIGV